MVWGQELDLTFEEKPATAEELREVHRNKTGMLINAAAVSYTHLDVYKRQL